MTRSIDQDPLKESFPNPEREGALQQVLRQLTDRQYEPGLRAANEIYASLLGAAPALANHSERDLSVRAAGAG
jgi:hypothetical protein